MDKYRDKVLAIVALAMEASAKTKADVFVRYSGHIDALDVDIHPNGWRKDYQESEVKRYEMHPQIHTEESIIKTLDEVISDLNSLLTKEDA